MRIQKELMVKKLRNDEKKAVVTQEKSHSLLELCKSWGGPVMNKNDFDKSHALCQIKNIPEKLFIKKEISFRRILCPRDAKQRVDLYRLNKLTTEQLKLNLIELVTTDLIPCLEMPDEEEIVEIVQKFFE